MTFVNNLLKAFRKEKEKPCEHKNLQGEIVILDSQHCKDCLKTVSNHRITAKELFKHLEIEPMTQSQGGKEDG